MTKRQKKGINICVQAILPWMGPKQGLYLETQDQQAHFAVATGNFVYSIFLLVEHLLVWY